MGWAWQLVVAVLRKTTAACGLGQSVRPRGREVHMQGGLWALSHHPEENHSFKSPKAQGRVADELGKCQVSGAGIWTASLLQGPALFRLARKHLPYVCHEKGWLGGTSLCNRTEQELGDPRKELSLSGL